MTTEKLKAPARRYDLDFLRILAVMLLFFFHTAQFFTPWEWHLKNSQGSRTITYLAAFINMWHMPLFFLLSGAASRFALEFRSGRQYLRERFFRIFVPFLFGMMILIPPQVYLERVWRGQFTGSYLEFYPHFFEGVYPQGNLSWHHLWFLIYLFVFSLLARPIFTRLHSDSGRRLIERLAKFTSRKKSILLLAVPLIVFELCLRPIWPDRGGQNLVNDWANFVYYLTLFIYGFLLFSDQRIQEAVDRDAKAALGLAVLTATALYFISITRPWPDGSPRWLIVFALWAANCWFWLLAILAAGKKYLNLTSPLLRYLSEAALPVYILHQTVIVLIGYRVIKWDLGVWTKYAVICASAIAATFLAYELLVKRTNPTRFLFGLKKKKPGATL